MEEEMQALIQNGTWELVAETKDAKPIACKWAYKLKVQHDELIERYNA